MKKIFRMLIVTAAMLCILSVTAYADMAPKPKIIINIENAPNEVYYLDLLSSRTPDIGTKHNSEMVEKYGKNIVDTMYSLEDNGWYPQLCNEYTMTYGDLTADENGQHVFSYNVPDKFRVIIVTKNGDVKISDPILRGSFQVDMTLDYETMSYTRRPVWQVYPLQFLSSFIPTVIIELIVLIMFRFKIRENLKVFVFTNFITQLALNVTLSTMLVFEGTGGFLYGWVTILSIEFAIAYCEANIYEKRLTGFDKKRRFYYGITANVISALFTFISLPVMIDNMIKIAGYII